MEKYYQYCIITGIMKYMEIILSTVFSFILGITIGSITMNFHWIKKSQKTRGDKSPNVMGDSNSIKM